MKIPSDNAPIVKSSPTEGKSPYEIKNCLIYIPYCYNTYNIGKIIKKIYLIFLPPYN